MLLSKLGLVEPTQPDITLSGLNPFELRQSGEAQISKTHTRVHPCAHTHTHANPHKRIKKKKKKKMHADGYRWDDSC